MGRVSEIAMGYCQKRILMVISCQEGVNGPCGLHQSGSQPLQKWCKNDLPPRIKLAVYNIISWVFSELKKKPCPCGDASHELHIKSGNSLL